MPAYGRGMYTPVYPDIPGYERLYHGTSRHIEAHQGYGGIPGYTKLYQDYHCVSRYIYLGIHI